VAGTNLIQSPDQLLSIVRAGVLSPTSTCHTFSDAADGYGRADGISCLLIKRLSDAVRDNDPIRAVIRGTAVNSNGKTPGITLPSSKEQETVIRKAYARAGLTYDETSYVECHGTGTPVGDPIEVEGVSQVFGQCLPVSKRRQPLLIGSVKTNFGHSEAASGLTSIMKTVLAMEHRAIPATIGVGTVNPKIKTKEWNVDVVQRLTSWGSTGQTLRAGVNSFGYGGANAHAILESADQRPSGDHEDRNCLNRKNHDKTYLLPVSADSLDALERRMEDLVEYMSKTPVAMADLAYTLSQRRTHFSHRSFLLATQNVLLRNQVDPTPDLISGGAIDHNRAGYLFMFTGQGAQWAEMGRSLFHEYPAFADAISEMDGALRALPGHTPAWTIKDTIFEPAITSQIHKAARSQPVCTALQVALVILLNSWGISPSAVVGHSSGEIAAAFATGQISSAEAIITAYFRGLAVEQFASNGAMIAVGLGREAADSEIRSASLRDRIRVACVNSPESVTLSGDDDAVDCLMESLISKKIFVQKLNTGGYAYHSHHMAMIGDIYEALITDSKPQSSTTLKLATTVKWVSSVTGQEYLNVPDAGYWRANLENPVLFSDAVQNILTTEKNYQLVEIGPHSALKMPIKQIQKNLKHQATYTSAMVRFTDGVESILRMVGHLYVHHGPVSWKGINHPEIGRPFKVVHSLPPYPWIYGNLLWEESRLSSELRHRQFLRHELLGSAIPAGNGVERSWRNILRLKDVDWIKDHKLADTVVFPGAGYIAMAIEAMRQIAIQTFQILRIEKLAYSLQNVKILAALAVSTQPKAEIELFTTLRPRPITLTTNSQDWWDFVIISYDAEKSTVRATGTISWHKNQSSINNGSKFPADELELSHPRTWYRNLARVGLNFGSNFQSIQSFDIPSRKDNYVSRAQTSLIRSYEDEIDQYPIHPITLDAMLQATIVASCSGDPQNLQAKVPVAVKEILLQTQDTNSEVRPSCHIEAMVRIQGFGIAEGDADLISATGSVVARMIGLKMVAYNGANQLGRAKPDRCPMLRVVWKPDIYRLSALPPEVVSTFFQNSITSTDMNTEEFLRIGTCLDWIAHKHPNLKVLELGNGDHLTTNKIISFLGGSSMFPRIQSLISGAMFPDGKLYGSQVDIQNGLDGPLSDNALVPLRTDDHFNIILMTCRSTSQSYINTHLELINQYLAPDGGVLITLADENSTLRVLEQNFQIMKLGPNTVGGQLIIAHKGQDKTQNTLPDTMAIIVVDRGNTIFTNIMAQKLSKMSGRIVTRLSFAQVSDETIPMGSLVISLLEAETPILARSSGTDMKKIKIITGNAAKLVWITSGDLMGGRRPDFGVVFGLSRAVMTEQPSLQWYVYDIDDIAAAPEQTVQNILSILYAEKTSRQHDFEFLQKDGIIYVSRFVPDENLNRKFRQQQGSELLECSLESAKPLQLDITEAGNLDTVHFKQVETPVHLAEEEVQISLQTVSVNAKDYYAVGGKTETRNATCTNECCGVVERVGSRVTGFVPGDRVVVMAPGHFRTSEIFPSWACQKLLDNESFDTMCSLPLVYSTALYALRDRANLRPGDSVLVHSATGGLGIAAIAIARLLGAGEIFVTTSTDEKKNYLTSVLGIKSENIFSSRDALFFPGIMKATNGRGVDIVLNSLVGDLLHASWKCCSSFGRFVEVGKRDLIDCGKLEMEEFLKCATFSAFDLSDLYYHPNQAYTEKWTQLLKDVLQLYRTGQIGEVNPLKVFDVSDTTDALRYFSTQNRVGKVLISLQNSKTSCVRIKRRKYNTILSPEKYYLMVGCLGGLGRSMSRWMLSRGARKFAFLGRSGAKQASARRLITDLEYQGATCMVFQGDVCARNDVEAMFAAVDGKIGGVVQAAMGLHVSGFSFLHWRHILVPPLNISYTISVIEADSQIAGGSLVLHDQRRLAHLDSAQADGNLEPSQRYNGTRR
jgi:acyl transferase domain-containing protein/NADPH:quinone reductase-like Zn-dependent oxidoreductase